MVIYGTCRKIVMRKDYNDDFASHQKMRLRENNGDEGEDEEVTND